MTKWVMGNVVHVKHWTESLFSFIIHASINTFTAGQFTKLGLEINGERIQRAYSYVNAPKNNNLEFYLVTVPGGTLSPRLHRLQSGDNLMITKEAMGFFVLDEIPSCDNLWMLATGTGLGPYLSILEQGEGLSRFNKIILVHAVRFVQDLSYLPKMLELQQRFNRRLCIQTVISREQAPRSLTGRIPDLIADGSLEASVGVKLNAENSHVMLCGNPKMIYDMQQLLKDSRGMYKNFKHKPGHITSERYW